MPKYFFNTDVGAVRLIDEEGCDLDGEQAALRLAANDFGQILRDFPRGITPGVVVRMDICDEVGTPIFEAAFSIKSLK